MFPRGSWERACATGKQGAVRKRQAACAGGRGRRPLAVAQICGWTHSVTRTWLSPCGLRRSCPASTAAPIRCPRAGLLGTASNPQCACEGSLAAVLPPWLHTVGSRQLAICLVLHVSDGATDPSLTHMLCADLRMGPVLRILSHLTCWTTARG